MTIADDPRHAPGAAETRERTQKRNPMVPLSSETSPSSGTSSRPALRAGIIGTGGIAHAHAEAIRSLGGEIELVAVADVDRRRAEEFAARYGVASAHTDSAEMLDSAGLDIVHVCTPPRTHAPLAIQAMRAGVPVLVEKPTVLSLGELDEIARVQEETGVPTMTVFQHRFGPAARHLRSLVAEGALGRPLVATCDTLWFRPDEYFDVLWRRSWEESGGGPTMGHGIHQFDLMLSIFGPWQETFSFAARQSRPTDTEDVSASVVRFANGAIATVVNSIVSPRETSRLRFDFELATVEVEHLYGYTADDWTFTPAPGHEHLAERWEAGLADRTRSSHGDQLATIVEALREGTPPEVGLAEARRTLEFAAATYASAFRGETVTAGQLRGEDPFMRTMSGGITPWAPLAGHASV
jgi:predicted dehydrogenase